jgi:acyl-CoA thioesterase FadM
MRSHHESVTIRFDDADPAGVVFYPRAIALAHAVVENLIRHCPIGWDAWFASPTHAAPLRRAEADFFLPMRAGQTFAAEATVEKIGRTSVTFAVEFRDRDAHLAARVRTTHVFTAKSDGRPAPLPATVRDALGPTP